MAIKRQQIVDAVETRLKTILTSNGYYTDLGNEVYVWLQRPIEDAKTLSAIIRDLEQEEITFEDQNSTHLHRKNLEVEIEIVSSSASALRQAEADVNKAIGTDPTWGGLAELTRPYNSVPVFPDQKERKRTGIARTIIIQYKTEAWQED